MNQELLDQQTQAQAQAYGPDSETLPPRAFTDGRLNDEGRALAAIKAMPKSEIAERVESWITAYEESMADRHFMERHFEWVTKRPLFALWHIVELLARAVTKLQVDAKAHVIQTDQQQQFLRLLGDHKDLRSFLFTHFGVELEEAESLNKPLLRVAMEIMLRKK